MVDSQSKKTNGVYNWFKKAGLSLAVAASFLAGLSPAVADEVKDTRSKVERTFNPFDDLGDQDKKQAELVTKRIEDAKKAEKRKINEAMAKGKQEGIEIGRDQAWEAISKKAWENADLVALGSAAVLAVVLLTYLLAFRRREEEGETFITQALDAEDFQALEHLVADITKLNERINDGGSWSDFGYQNINKWQVSLQFNDTKGSPAYLYIQPVVVGDVVYVKINHGADELMYPTSIEGDSVVNAENRQSYGADVTSAILEFVKTYHLAGDAEGFDDFAISFFEDGDSNESGGNNSDEEAAEEPDYTDVAKIGDFAFIQNANSRREYYRIISENEAERRPMNTFLHSYAAESAVDSSGKFSLELKEQDLKISGDASDYQIELSGMLTPNEADVSIVTPVSVSLARVNHDNYEVKFKLAGEVVRDLSKEDLTIEGLGSALPSMQELVDALVAKKKV